MSPHLFSFVCLLSCVASVVKGEESFLRSHRRLAKPECGDNTCRISCDTCLATVGFQDACCGGGGGTPTDPPPPASCAVPGESCKNDGQCCNSAVCFNQGQGVKTCQAATLPGYTGSNCNVQGPLPGTPGYTLKLKFYTMGDSPYDYAVGFPFEGPQYVCLRDVILPRLSEGDLLYDGKEADFMVHIGDIQKGDNTNQAVPYCNETMFQSRLDLFKIIEPKLDFFLIPGECLVASRTNETCRSRFSHCAYFNSGDNEWNECINFDGSPNPPVDSAEELWRSFFASPTSPFYDFDRASLLKSSSVAPPLVTRMEDKYPENFFFTYQGVAFFGINEPDKHDAFDPDVLYSAYNGDTNAYWVATQLSNIATPPSAIVVFGHAVYSAKVKEVLQAQESTPILYIMGNSHPADYCMAWSSGFTYKNALELTVEPFKAGPLLISVLEDESSGDVYFHVEETAGCT